MTAPEATSTELMPPPRPSTEVAPRLAFVLLSQPSPCAGVIIRSTTQQKGAAWALLLALIHRSAWYRNSRKFGAWRIAGLSVADCPRVLETQRVKRQFPLSDERRGAGLRIECSGAQGQAE